MAAEIVLGTAALGGQAYAGQALQQSAVDGIICKAVELGIRKFDTAPTYGKAEEWLGRMLGNFGFVATKVQASEFEFGSGLYDVLARSLSRLRRDRLDLVQVHNPDAVWFESASGRTRLGILESLRDRGAIGMVGASVYGTAAAFAAIRSGLVGQVQLPYNLLDQAARKDGVLREARRRGVTVWTRSSWLRGALSGVPDATVPAPAVEAARSLCRRLRVRREDTATVALRFCLHTPHVSGVVAGLRSAREVEIAMMARAAGPLGLRQRLLAATAFRQPLETVDPRFWDRPETGVDL